MVVDLGVVLQEVDLVAVAVDSVVDLAAVGFLVAEVVVVGKSSCLL